MARRKKTKRSMKKDDSNAKDNSKYGVKWRNMRKGLFTKNSPFSGIGNKGKGVVIDARFRKPIENNGVIDKMIIKNRGEYHDGKLPPTKFEDTRPNQAY